MCRALHAFSMSSSWYSLGTAPLADFVLHSDPYQFEHWNHFTDAVRVVQKWYYWSRSFSPVAVVDFICILLNVAFIHQTAANTTKVTNKVLKWKTTKGLAPAIDQQRKLYEFIMINISNWLFYSGTCILHTACCSGLSHCYCLFAFYLFIDSLAWWF